MPKVSVYIRNEDMEAWSRLPSKTGFISAALQVAEELPSDPFGPFRRSHRYKG